MVSALQADAIRVRHATPSPVATLSIGAFNTGNMLGAWVGSSVVDHSLGLTRISLAATVLAALVLLTTLIVFSENGRAQAQSTLD